MEAELVDRACRPSELGLQGFVKVPRVLVDSNVLFLTVESLAAGDAAKALRGDRVGHEREEDEQEEHANVAALADVEMLIPNEPEDDSNDDHDQAHGLRFGHCVNAGERGTEAVHAHRGKKHLEGAGDDEDQGYNVGDEVEVQHGYSAPSLLRKRATDSEPMKPSMATTNMALTTVVSSVQQM